MVDQVHSGGKADDTAIPPIIRRPMSDLEREEFKKIMAKSYKVNLDMNPMEIRYIYDGEYIEYQLLCPDVVTGKKVYKRIFRCFNIEGGTKSELVKARPRTIAPMVVEKEEVKKTKRGITAPRPKK
jgi:hypothetical protein